MDTPRTTIKQEGPRMENETGMETENNRTDQNGNKLYGSVLGQNEEVASLLKSFNLNIASMTSFIEKVKYYCSRIQPKEELQLLKLTVQCIDLTTLSGDDTATNVERLCLRAKEPLNEDDIHCAAVCVYPARATDCRRTFEKIGGSSNIKTACVATGFPSGQYGLKTRLAEIRYAIECGANEIDVVINRTAALMDDWVTVYEEICQMRAACDEFKQVKLDVHLKVIIGAGDLLISSPRTIYMASLIAILAGADFIKTSTGKEGVNATLPIGYIMMRCILDYYLATGISIGFKPAGGIRTHKDALHWLIMLKMMLGQEWLNPDLFRFGASGLLDDVRKRILVLSGKQHD